METEFRSSFAKDVRKIKDKALLRRVQETIDAVDQAGKLDEIPGIRKMAGWKRYFRIEVGDYRVGVTVDGDVVTFIQCLNRKDIYRYFS